MSSGSWHSFPGADLGADAAGGLGAPVLRRTIIPADSIRPPQHGWIEGVGEQLHQRIRTAPLFIPTLHAAHWTVIETVNLDAYIFNKYK